MQMPVVVGIIVAVILLVAFTGWFYNLVKGWEEYILDDIYFWYRVGGATLFSITIMTLTFFGMAYVYECPDQVFAEGDTVSETLSQKLNCPAFNNIRTGAEDIFKKQFQEKPVEIEEDNSLESQTEEI